MKENEWVVIGRKDGDGFMLSYVRLSWLSVWRNITVGKRSCELSTPLWPLGACNTGYVYGGNRLPSYLRQQMVFIGC